MRVISLGWGVQSWTLAAMAALGEIQADVAIHADTTWEKSSTYAFVEKWQPWLEAQGLRVVTVGDKAQAAKAITAETDAPVFSVKPSAYFAKKDGQLRRQCTQRWKIEPIRRWLREELQRQGLRKSPGVVTSLQGISLDEFHRMRTSDVKWIANQYPLVDLRMTRADCVTWLQRNDLPVPPKSSCVFCPFQNPRSWQELKRNPDDWKIAVEVDTAIRTVRPPFDLFVHPARVPLNEAVTLPEDHGFTQANMLIDYGCDSGYCFV